MYQSGLIDSHIHLQSYNSDVQVILEQAESAGVTHFVCNGTSEDDWQDVAELTKSHKSIVPCFGLHPWFVNKRTNRWISILEEFLQAVPSGIGEIGLDKNIEGFDKDAQEQVFRVQLGLARKYDRPAMIHCVKSWGWLMDVLNDEPELPKMLIHAYSGSVDLIKPLVKMGSYFTFSGSVLQSNFERSRKAILEIPPDRLLIESDAPYMLPPAEYRTYNLISSDGKELNHPGNLPRIVEGIAELLGEQPESLRDRLWENSKQFFASLIDDYAAGTPSS